MNVLWSRVGEEADGEATEFVLAFPDATGKLAFTASMQSQGAAIFRQITANADGNEPVLFTRNGAEPLHLWFTPVNSGLPPTKSIENDVAFQVSMRPTHAQLFLAHVTPDNIVFEIGPRVKWPGAPADYDARSDKIQGVADAIRATSQFRNLLASATSRKSRTDEIIFITATPLIDDQTRTTVAPALDLWPRLALKANIKVSRDSNRRPLLAAKMAIAEQYERVTQLFADWIELDVEGDHAVASSLVLSQVRRQGVARAPLAKTEPEIEVILPRGLKPIIEHELNWDEADGRQVANVDRLVASRGDWFLLISPDADLDLESLRDPDGVGIENPISGFPPGEQKARATRVIAWRHDGRRLKTFRTYEELKTSSDPHSGGLIDKALQQWTDPDDDLSIRGLWGTMLKVLSAAGSAVALRDVSFAPASNDASGAASNASRAEFISRIIGENGRAHRRLIARHSPFVALAALARWNALERLAAKDDWKAGIGNDDRSIDRLLSPVAEWLARGAAEARLIVPVNANSDDADDFLRSAQFLGHIRLNYPPDPARMRVEPAANAGLGLLLLSDDTKLVKSSELAEEAEIAGAALCLRDAIDPRAHGLIRIFAQIFSGQPDQRATNFAFYRAIALEMKKAADRSAREEALLKALYNGRREAQDFFTVEDLNGGPLDIFDALDEFDLIFSTLKKTFAGMS
jgi:hypothetical protein